MTTFYSKRNNVELIDSKVVKTFRNESDFRREMSVYKRLRQSGNIKIPEIVDVDEYNFIITIRYLNGPTVLETLEKLEVDSKTDLAVQVILNTITWLDSFYEAFEDNNQIMGDVNLRNFIWFDNKVFGIDFESSCIGNTTSEKAELLARYLLYDPSESDFKIKVMQQVLMNLKVQDDFKVMIDNEVEAIKIRRGKSNADKQHSSHQ